MALVSARQLFDHPAEFGHGLPAFTRPARQVRSTAWAPWARSRANSLAMTGAMRRTMAEDPSRFDPLAFEKAARAATSEIRASRFEAFGSAGLASRLRPMPLEATAETHALEHASAAASDAMLAALPSRARG
jgi:hypothetical protein